MSDAEGRPIWLTAAALYVGLLAAAVAVGVVVPEAGDPPRDALVAPVVAGAIGLVCLAAAVGSFVGRNWGRLLFLLSAPWGSLALASVFPGALWVEDVPYTAALVFVYVPLALLVSRAGTLERVGLGRWNWFTRGGDLMAALVLAVFFARLFVTGSEPQDRGGGRMGLAAHLDELNDYVKRLVVVDVVMWNYVGALVAVSFPTRSPPPAGDEEDGRLLPDMEADAVPEPSVLPRRGM